MHLASYGVEAIVDGSRGQEFFNMFCDGALEAATMRAGSNTASTVVNRIWKSARHLLPTAREIQQMPAKKKIQQTVSPAPADAVPPSIALEDIVHSGHLFYILKRARCGAKPAIQMLMLIYRESVDHGKEPRPAVHAFISTALGDIQAGRDANHAFGLKKDRSGRDKRSLAGDVPPIITDEEGTAKLIEAVPEYRDWLIAHRLHEAGASTVLDKKTRKDMAEKFHTSPSTVDRAWEKYLSPRPDLQMLTDSFAVVEKAWSQFNAFVAQHRNQEGAKTIAAKWREHSVKSLRMIARKAAAESTELPPAVLWSRGVVNNPELVLVLFLCLEQFDVDGHPARITEEEAKAEFMRAVEVARKRTRPKGR